MNMIQVNGDPLAWKDGMTVRDVLTAKRFTFPMLVITVDDDIVDRKDYDTTVIPDGANVKVVHLMSGG
jgi:sulfur carrier protein